MLLAATVLTYSLMTLSLEYEPAALNLVTAPSAAVNCATHIGTRTDMRPLLSAMAVMLLAVPPVTQPPQTNPIVIAATAPKAIPWRKRLRASPCKMSGILMMIFLFCARGGSQPQTSLTSVFGTASSSGDC